MKIEFLRVGSCCHPEWVTLQGGALASIDFPALAVLIQHPSKGNFLFDTGYASQFNRVTQKFPESVYRWVTPIKLHEHDSITHQLGVRGIAPEAIAGIFISHFHADHIAALRDFWKAQYLSLSESYEAVRPLNGIAALRRGFLPKLLPDDFLSRYQTIESCSKILALPEKMRPFTHGWDVFGDGSAYAVNLPGHARGQMGLWLNQVNGLDEDVFLVADACWSSRAYQELRAPSWLSFLLHDNRAAYLQTLQDIHDLAQHNAHVIIMPSHCNAMIEKYTGARHV